MLVPVGCKPGQKQPWEMVAVLQVQLCGTNSCCWERALRHKGRNAEVPPEAIYTSMRTEPEMQPVPPKKEICSPGQAALRSHFLLLWEMMSIWPLILFGGGEGTKTSCSRTYLLWPWISRTWAPLCSALETSLGGQKATGPSILWAGLFTT